MSTCINHVDKCDFGVSIVDIKSQFYSCWMKIMKIDGELFMFHF